MAKAAIKTRAPAPRAPRPRKTLSENDVRVIVHEIIDSLELDKAHSTVHSVAHAAAKTAVEETLMSIGVNTKDPIAAQQSFAALRNLVNVFSDAEFQADLSHLRQWRVSVNQVRSKGLLTAIGLAVTGAAFLLAIGFKMWAVK